MATWKRNGWRTTAKKPVKNEDLWRALDEVTPIHRVDWKWVKGHSGQEGNERCDQLANEEIAKIKAAYSTDQLQEFLTVFILKSELVVTEEAPAELF
jgi:ribonuclease HI